MSELQILTGRIYNSSKMRLKLDKENDALYFRLNETEIAESEKVYPGVILNFDKNGNVTGIESMEISTSKEHGEAGEWMINLN